MLPNGNNIKEETRYPTTKIPFLIGLGYLSNLMTRLTTSLTRIQLLIRVYRRCKIMGKDCEKRN